MAYTLSAFCLVALRTLTGRQISANAPGDPRGGILDGIAGKMRIPGCGLHLCVTEQLADHREALAQGQRSGRITVPEIMDPHVLQLGASPDAAPRLLQIGDVGTWQPAADDPGIALLAGQVRQYRAGLWPERHHPPASLRVGQLLSRRLFDHGFPGLFRATGVQISRIVRSVR